MLKQISAKMQAIKRNLDTQKVPQDLRPIVTYLSEIQPLAKQEAGAAFVEPHNYP